MILDWPATLTPQDVQILPPRRTAGLSRSLSGFTQAVPVIRPPFGLTLTFGNLFGDEVLAWRALIAGLEGRANCVRVPVFDLWFRASQEQLHAGGAAHSDGTAFSDGALYLTDDLVGVTVTGVQGQRNISVDFGDYGQLLQAGLYFGLGEHLHIAQAVWWTGSVATIRCSPTLRQDYADAPLRLKPTVIARQTSDDGGALTLIRGRYGAPTLQLEEAVDGLFS